jgi:radical SAM protein with 4Fe4S-binding SPASM domain
VVVWNSTPRCNLRCLHCYYGAGEPAGEPGIGEGGTGKAAWVSPAASVPPAGDELTTGQAEAFIDSLADFRVPVLLVSGGEPLLRPDILGLIRRAAGRGMRVTLSTNGTLIDRETARALKEAGVSYVGVSLDGLEEAHDRFRGRPGAFRAALEGIRNCRAVGQRVGLRFTLTRHNVGDLEGIFDLLETEDIPRVCFYHLVHSGRGREMAANAGLTHEETRRAVDLIIERSWDFVRRRLAKEVLTVDNHADGVYLYLRLLETAPSLAARVLQLLRRNGGNRSGVAIAAVNHAGDVLPDQFSEGHRLGNVTERPFGEVWGGEEHPLLARLRDRKRHLKGRCRSCVWLDVCNGNFRARAEALTGDYWAADPACYLTDEEIQRTVEGGT